MNLLKIFKSNVFSDKEMKKYLPKNVYEELQKIIDEGNLLTFDIADTVSSAMKEWAISKEATHYTHWFQPLTGSTAEKHESFLNINNKGEAILKFSGKELIQGEPDASSFPNGGLRSTFEARGYTAWDCTSPAFLKEDAQGNLTLCIPTTFCSYKAHALDKKTPLLRSMQAISKSALRVLRELGDSTTKKVFPSVGPEQEYFLVDKNYFAKRLDLITCGRTLFGAPAPKGQEMEDHYFGQIKDRIATFMKELDMELWKMGITAKTKHNEVAPSQFELANIHNTANISADQNQLVMEIMKKVALRHNLVCLLHEKPYAGVNGSGKHNNWSLSTNENVNLLEPGETPGKNTQFLLFLCALLKAFDIHSDLLRASASNYGNDYRLGGNEAPPSIISIFLGDELLQFLNDIANGNEKDKLEKELFEVGVKTLAKFPKDNTDRNRTSPLAFTGNKFEFRMVPSSTSISMPNVVLNTIAAESLDELANILAKSENKAKAITKYIKSVMDNHSKIIFNGDNYSKDWEKEAKKRNLENINSTVGAIKTYSREKSILLFEKYKVLSKEELLSRQEIYFERYSKQAIIEANTAVSMCRKEYFPAIVEYMNVLSKNIINLKDIGLETKIQRETLIEINKLFFSANSNLAILQECLNKCKAIDNYKNKAVYIYENIFSTLAFLRKDIDELEMLVGQKYWPVPSYADLMYKI